MITSIPASRDTSAGCRRAHRRTRCRIESRIPSSGSPRTYADGATDSYLVHGHYVPAHGSSKLTVWHNDYRVGGSDQPVM